MSKRRLAIVGASVRAAAQSAVRAGFEVVGADLFADADLDGVCDVTRFPAGVDRPDGYPAGLIDWFADQRVEAWLYTGALENHPEVIDGIASRSPLWGTSGRSLIRCRDPRVLRNEFLHAGIAFPETLPRGVARPDRGDWLAKTYRHSAGAGTAPHPGAASPEHFTQRIVSGVPHAAAFVIGPRSVQRLGVTRQLLGDGPDAWSYRGSIGPIKADTLGDPVQTMLDRLGDTLHGPLKLRGLVGVDFVAGLDPATVIEVNPRYPASLEVLERALHRSAIAALAAAWAGEPLPAWPSESDRVVGKRIVFARRATELSQAAAEWLAEQAAAGCVADVPRAGDQVAAGAPLCTVLVEAHDADATEQRLREAERTVLARVGG